MSFLINFISSNDCLDFFFIFEPRLSILKHSPVLSEHIKEVQFKSPSPEVEYNPFSLVAEMIFLLKTFSFVVLHLMVVF